MFTNITLNELLDNMTCDVRVNVYDDEEERVLQCGLADDIDAGYCGREVTQIFITRNVVEVWVKEKDV